MSKDDFYDRHHREGSEVQAMIAEDFPAVIDAARSDAAPPIMLKCPRGHSMLPVVAGMDGNWNLFLRSSADARGNGQVVTSSEPRDNGARDASVCWEPGCTVMCNSDYCADHRPPDYVNDEVEKVKSSLQCPSCSYNGNHTQATLLSLYAVAVAYGRKSIRLRV